MACRWDLRDLPFASTFRSPYFVKDVPTSAAEGASQNDLESLTFSKYGASCSIIVQPGPSFRLYRILHSKILKIKAGKMDEGPGFGGTQVYFERLCGQALADASRGCPDECAAVGTGHIVPMLPEEQSRLLCQEKARCYPERGLCLHGHFW